MRREKSFLTTVLFYPYETFNKKKKPTVWIIEIGNLGVRIRSTLLKKTVPFRRTGRKPARWSYMTADNSHGFTAQTFAGQQRLTASQKQRGKQKARGSANLVAKGSLINALWVFLNPGTWDLKLGAWINIFPPLQAAVLYLTFWSFIYVNMPAEATDSEVVNNTSPAPPKPAHIPGDKENTNPFVKPYSALFHHNAAVP